MPKGNIPETEKIRLVWTHQEKRSRQPLKQNDGHGRTGEAVYWKIMVKTGQ